jgi:hypothetical protein
VSTALAPVDPRLLDAVAQALCWAEFTASGHERRSDDPMSYWTGIAEAAKDGYRRSAEPLAILMRGDSKLAIIPEELSPEMLHAIRCCVRASEDNIRQAWSLALTEAWLALGRQVRGAEQ